MKKNYILIDYENVQPDFTNKLNEEHFCIYVFMGENQNKISVEFASFIQAMGSASKYIKISGNGNNALDFHIAYYIGDLTAKDPESFYHIISKDNGFDPLIKYLNEKKFHVYRWRSVDEIPAIKNLNLKSPSERASVVKNKFNKIGISKPKTLKTLYSSINALFQKTLSDDEINAIVEELKRQTVIIIDKTKVSYP